MTVINDVLNEMKIGKTISGEDSMELEQAIKRGLDRNGILFFGSGFSYGGQNSNGELLKIGKDLSHRNSNVKCSRNVSTTDCFAKGNSI